MDQMIQYYPGRRKNVNWTKKLVLYFIQLAIYNAHIIYHDNNPTERMSLMEFHLEVVKGLCNTPASDADSDAEPGPAGPVDCVVCTQNDPKDRLVDGFKVHKKAEFPPTAGKVHGQRACKVCKKRGLHRDTRFYCKKCIIALCPTNCFEIYHSTKRYY